MRQSDPVLVRWKDNSLSCSGFITFLNANEFIDQFAKIDFPENQDIYIDLYELSVGDGLALLVLGKSIASVGQHFKKIIINSPPGGLESYLRHNHKLKNISFVNNTVAIKEELAEIL